MKISKWIREERNKGKAVKVGLGKVSVESRLWWEEIERDMITKESGTSSRKETEKGVREIREVCRREKKEDEKMQNFTE